MILCLKEFNGVTNFLYYSKKLEETNWTIDKQLLKDRATFYNKHPVFLELKNEYLTKKISIFILKDEEVVTWLDTLLLMRRTLLLLFRNGAIQEDLKIIMEYPFVLGNQMRSDYLIIFKQSVIIIEFGMFNQDEKRKEERYTKKIQENIGHRHLLSNLIDSEIYTYVMMYRPEFDYLNNKTIKEHVNHNEEGIKKFSEFIEIVIKKQINKDGYQQLIQLESYR